MSCQHHLKQVQNEKKLWIALALTSSFLIVEIAGSLISQSLALLSDAAHLFTDAAALLISIIGIRLARMAADKKRTFGYYRFEILAAALNASILFIVALYICYEAYERFHTPMTVQTNSMLIVATLGAIINLISASLLQSGSKDSLNIKSAYLDAKADLISSIGVIITGILIKFTHWYWIDTIMAIAISLWLLPRTWILLKESINILLEGVPEGIDLNEINHALLRVAGIKDVHDLHVWALTSGKISLTIHVVIDESLANTQSLLKIINHLLAERFNITHTTIQVETIRCDEESLRH